MVLALGLVPGLSAGRLLADEERVTVKTSVDRAEVAVGEPIRYAVSVEHPPALPVEAPAVGEILDGFSVEQAGSEPRRIRHGVAIDTWRYRLSRYATGPAAIHAPAVTYRSAGGATHEARGEAVHVTVKSLLPADWASQDIRDIKPPIALPGRGWWLWGLGLLMVAAGAALVWWTRRRSGSLQPAAAPVRPPHEAALEALEQLRRDRLPDQGRYERHYVQLSSIARTYLEGRFGLRAPQMSTEEFLQAASRAAGLSPDHRRLLQDFLRCCDLVKFARYQPSAREAHEAFASAERFVQETKPWEDAPSPVRTSL